MTEGNIRGFKYGSHVLGFTNEDVLLSVKKISSDKWGPKEDI